MDTATNSPAEAAADPAVSIPTDRQGSTPVALLRITLGVILIVAWWDNLDKGLYNGDGFKGFINYLYSEDGNNSSLTFYESFVESVIFPLAGPYAAFQLVIELAIALGLLFGIFTRASALIAAVFFGNIFLAYFGGNEWIWTYVLLIMASVTVFLGYGGRKLGADQYLLKSKGESPFNLIW